jgi:hypothetical protein
MNQWKILLSFMPDGGAGLYREIPEELQKFVEPFLKTIAKGAEEKAAVKRVIKSTGPSSRYSYPVTIKGKRSPCRSTLPMEFIGPAASRATVLS